MHPRSNPKRRRLRPQLPGHLRLRPCSTWLRLSPRHLLTQLNMPDLSRQLSHLRYPPMQNMQSRLLQQHHLMPTMFPILCPLPLRPRMHQMPTQLLLIRFFLPPFQPTSRIRSHHLIYGCSLPLSHRMPCLRSDHFRHSQLQLDQRRFQLSQWVYHCLPSQLQDLFRHYFV